MLHIRSNNIIPELEEIETALDALVAGSAVEVITLDDWGVGPTNLNDS